MEHFPQNTVTINSMHKVHNINVAFRLWNRQGCGIHFCSTVMQNPELSSFNHFPIPSNTGVKFLQLGDRRSESSIRTRRAFNNGINAALLPYLLDFWKKVQVLGSHMRVIEASYE